MTEHFFDMDNSLWQTVGRAGDMVLLTFLTVLCSLPVVTAGAAVSALCYTAFRILEHSNENTWRSFFHSFRQNLVQGVALTGIFLVLGGMTVCDIRFMGWFAAQSGVSLGLVAAGWLICAFLGILCLLLLLWVFPLQARFENPVAATVKNALVWGILRLPETLKMLAGDGLLLGISAVCLLAAPEFFILPLMFFLPLCAVWNAWVLKDILRLEPGKTDRPVPDESP